MSDTTGAEMPEALRMAVMAALTQFSIDDGPCVQFRTVLAAGAPWPYEVLP